MTEIVTKCLCGNKLILLHKWKRGITALLVVFLMSLTAMVPGVVAQSEKDSSAFYMNKASLLAFRGVYDSSILYFDRSSKIFSENQDDIDAIKAEIKIADVLIQKGAFAESNEKIAEITLLIIQDAPENKVLESDLLQLKGNYYLYTGLIDSARHYLKSAYNVRSKAVNKPDSSFAYSLGKLGYVEYMNGNYDTAYSLYNRALALALKKKSNNNYEVSTYYQGLGIALTMKGHYADAERNFRKSLEISTQYFSESDPALGRLYLNLGRFYITISKIEEAYNYYLKSERIFLNSLDRNNINLGFVYWNIGNYFYLKGDYGESINYLQQAYFIFSQHLPSGHPRLRDLIMDLGVAYEKKGNLQEAIHYYELSLQDNNTPTVTKSYRNLANAYNAEGNQEMAQKSYVQAIKAAKKYTNNGNLDLALCYRYYGQFLLDSLQDKHGGLEYYDMSLNILNDILQPNHEDLARAYLLYGEYFLKDSQLKKASENINIALNIITSMDDTDSSKESEQLSTELGMFLSEAYDLKARVFYALYQKSDSIFYLNKCLESIYASVKIINELRMSYSTEESKLQIMSRAKATINTGIAAAFKLYELTGDQQYAHEVFELAERSKSIVLLNSLRGLEALKMSHIPEELTAKEHQLKSDLFSYTSLIYKEKQRGQPDETKIQFWQNTVFNLKKQYDSLLVSFEVDYPSFYKLKYDNSVISADTVIKYIEPDQALVEFSSGDTSIYITVLTKDGLHSICIDNSDTVLDYAMATYTESLRKNTLGNYGRKDFEDFASSAYTIYQKLILPIENWIGYKRLILVPDGKLGYLSFDGLVTSSPDLSDPDYRSLDYLVLRQAVSYSSSATILYSIDNGLKKKVRNKMLAFAPEYNSDSDGSTLRSSERGIDSLRLLPIKGVEEEVHKILSIFSGREFAGEMATEYNFKKYAGKYNVLHLAMHTLIDNTNPLYSKMVFTSGGDKSEDGLLNTYELFSMDLEGSLGVLSACNTGTGKLQKGEGIMSLARGFIYAGIPNLVMTLWEIEDQSSSDIMTIFYQYLKEGLPTDLAMQKAKIDYIKSADKLKSHPTYWAGFVNIGKTSTVPNSNPILRYWWVLAIIALIFTIIFINRRVYRRKKTD